MQRLFSPRCIINRKITSLLTGKTIQRYFIAVTRPLAAIERQERLRDASNDLISAAMTQPQTEVSQSSALLPIDSTISPQSLGVLEAQEVSTSPDVAKDKALSPFEDIPGPAVLKIFEKYWKYVPLFGQLSWNRNVTPLKYLFNEYGPIVRIHGPFTGDVVMIHRPEHIAEVYKQEGQSPVRSGIDVLQYYRSHSKKCKFPGPFTNMQGTEWIELRTKLEKPFTDQLTVHFGKLETNCDELVQRIRKIRNRQDEVPGDFSQDIARWGMESFFITMMNKRVGFLDPSGLNAASEPARIIEAVANAHLYLSRCETGFQVWRFFETPFTKRLFAACDVIDGVIGKYIRQAQNKLRSMQSALTFGDKRPNDDLDDDGIPFLEKLLLYHGLQPDDISTLMMDIIILGVQAITNSEAFLLYYLARNPRVQRRLYDEIVTVLPSRGLSWTRHSLEEMPYLRACMNECLRLRPAFPYVTRILPKPITLHGYTIPKGTCMIMANQITSHREENFDDPDRFKPERWLAGNTECGHNQEFSCLPFGYGIRSCLGKQMAETEMMLLTAKLVREFRIEYDYADISSKFMMVNVPNKPLKFRFIDRD